MDVHETPFFTRDEAQAIKDAGGDTAAVAEVVRMVVERLMAEAREAARPGSGTGLTQRDGGNRRGVLQGTQPRRPGDTPEAV